MQILFFPSNPFSSGKNFAMSMYIVQKEGEKGIISQFVYYILLNFCKG